MANFSEKPFLPTSSEMKHGAVIFVNPIEYHGPHLPLTTDYEISAGLLERMRTELARTHPEVSFTVEKVIQRGAGPAPGPGSQHTNHEKLADELCRECDAVFMRAERGETKRPDFFVFMTFHGAPRHAWAIERAIEYVDRKGTPGFNPFNLALLKMRDYDPAWVLPFAHLIRDEAYREKWILDLPKDFHGGTFETAMVLCHAGEKVKDISGVPDCPDRTPGFWWKLPLIPIALFGFLLGKSRSKNAMYREWEIAIDALHWERLPSYNGYTGAPRMASRELGEELTKVLLRDYLDAFAGFLKRERKSPKPLLQWSVKLG